jgi:two-component system phosphate regulon response regulator OmpR
MVVLPLEAECPAGGTLMPVPPTILVIDDDPDVREMLEEYLSKRGFTVLTAAGGEAMRRVIAAHDVDVVVLDRRMPGEDGLQLAAFLHTHYAVGIIMLTAAGEVADRIAGLQMGADDYLPKPFDPRELLARIHSVIRRMEVAAHLPPATAASASPSGIRFGRGMLDLEQRQFHTPEGDAMPLTAMECALLQAFVMHPNEILSREQLLALAHERGWETFDRSIDVRIARLRRKIEVDPAHPQAIKTMRGAGYMFVPHHDVP